MLSSRKIRKTRKTQCHTDARRNNKTFLLLEKRQSQILLGHRKWALQSLAVIFLSQSSCLLLSMLGLWPLTAPLAFPNATRMAFRRFYCTNVKSFLYTFLLVAVFLNVFLWTFVSCAVFLANFPKSPRFRSSFLIVFFLDSVKCIWTRSLCVC